MPKKKLKIKFDSHLVPQEQQEFIFSWTSASKFQLLYRASRDGFSAQDFHTRCDEKGKTLTIIEDTNGLLFGGFTSIPWSSPSSWTYKCDPSAFLFTLQNNSNTTSARYAIKPDHKENAVCHDKDFLVIFGIGSDLRIFSGANETEDSSSYPASYENPRGDYFFKARDIEVFLLE